MDTETIRIRASSQGWRILELPIRRRHPDPERQDKVVAEWKLIASTASGRSCEIHGPTLDEAMQRMGKVLGLIPRE